MSVQCTRNKIKVNKLHETCCNVDEAQNNCADGRSWTSRSTCRVFHLNKVPKHEQKVIESRSVVASLGVGQAGWGGRSPRGPRGLWGHGCVNDPDLLVTHQIKHLCSLFCANCTTTKSVKRLFEMIINCNTLSELSHEGSDVADAGAIPAVSPCVSQRPGLALFHQGRAPQFWQRAGKRGHQREGHE